MLNFILLTFNFTFPYPATSLMLGIIDVHNQIFFYLIIITTLVIWLLSYSLYTSISHKSVTNYAMNFEHCTLLELVWTILPAFILFSIALPSLSLLYSFDSILATNLTLKVIGRQWYWTYEYPDIINLDSNRFLSFDSNLLLSEIDPGLKSLGTLTNYKRLLSVDSCTIIPINLQIKALITSTDVLHSWAIPSFGIKVDACPGRINQVNFKVLSSGYYYGQCSELCGIGHGFMPINIAVVSEEMYRFWYTFIIKKYTF